jgi:hypothetical protein
LPAHNSSSARSIGQRGVPATPAAKVDAAPALHRHKRASHNDEQGEQSDQEQDH